MSKINEVCTQRLDFADNDLLDLDELLVSYSQTPVSWDFRDEEDISSFDATNWDSQEIFLGGADVSDGLELF